MSFLTLFALSVLFLLSFFPSIFIFHSSLPHVLHSFNLSYSLSLCCLNLVPFFLMSSYVSYFIPSFHVFLITNPSILLFYLPCFIHSVMLPSTFSFFPSFLPLFCLHVHLSFLLSFLVLSFLSCFLHLPCVIYFLPLVVSSFFPLLLPSLLHSVMFPSAHLFPFFFPSILLSSLPCFFSCLLYLPFVFYIYKLTQRPENSWKLQTGTSGSST